MNKPNKSITPHSYFVKAAAALALVAQPKADQPNTASYDGRTVKHCLLTSKRPVNNNPIPSEPNIKGCKSYSIKDTNDPAGKINQTSSKNEPHANNSERHKSISSVVRLDGKAQTPASKNHHTRNQGIEADNKFAIQQGISEYHDETAATNKVQVHPSNISVTPRPHSEQSTTPPSGDKVDLFIGDVKEWPPLSH